MTEWLDSYRLVTFIPEEALDNFISAISGHIPSLFGKYDRVVWWSAPGTEQYREMGVTDTIQNPSIRVEISLPRDENQLENFINKALKPHHPWDEPVIIVQDIRTAKPDL
jgi:hypothetical protein